MERRYRETASESIKQEYETFMRITPCKECGGRRLKKTSLAVTVCDKNIYEITSMSITNLYNFLDTMQLTQQQQLIGKRILKEIRARVGFLASVGNTPSGNFTSIFLRLFSAAPFTVSQPVGILRHSGTGICIFPLKY